MSAIWAKRSEGLQFLRTGRLAGPEPLQTALNSLAMRRLAWAAAIVAGLLAVSGAVLASHQAARSADRIVVAIVREDGVIVPFAEYRSDTWVLPGVELTNRATPWFNTPEPAPTTWAFPSIQSAGVIITTDATKVATHCESYFGLASDYRGRAVPANTAHRNIGAAVSGAGQVEGPIALDAADPAAAAILALVRSRFDGAESAALSAEPVLTAGGAERARVPLAFPKILRSRSRIEGRSLFFVEAARRYREHAPRADPGCAPESVWQAWLSQDAAGVITFLHSAMTLTDCDHKNLARVTPFAIASIDGRWFIVGEELGYESERYVIFEIEPRAIVRRVAVWAGGC